MKLMKLFGKKKKLNNAEKVLRAKLRIEASLGMFSRIHKDLEEANTELTAVIQEDTALIEKTQLNINSAQAELEDNKVLQEKIKVFTKEQ